MPPRPPYALPEDVLRLFDAQESMYQLDPPDLDLIRDAIDDVSSDFELQTGHAFRLTRVGSPGAPETYEYAGIEGSHNRPPVRVSLDHRFVLPFNSAEGDVLEYRSGRDEWTAITDKAGDEFTLKYKSGHLKVYRWLINRIVWEVPDDRYIRGTFRYGALGGRQEQGGQTTLTSSVGDSSGETTLDVENAGRLFAGKALLLYAGDTAEYVDVESIDYDADTVTVSRGERSTDPASFDSGDVVHYCPPGARMAFAAKAAEEHQLYELFTDRTTDTGDGIGASDRVEKWSQKYDALCAKYSTVRKL